MGIPFFGRMHIPSCDFAALISPRHFRAFAMPALEQEVRAMTHNIFHVDGKGVAVHLDAILELPNVGALQWVQGAGNGQPILQWVPLIRRMVAAGQVGGGGLEASRVGSLHRRHGARRDARLYGGG